jgi:hypothetical protein
MNGDNLDFTSISKHLPEHAFQGTLQLAINRVHKLLAEIRANAPNSKIIYIAGNHEQRLEKYVASKSPELFELRQAGQEKRVLTVPFLLNLDAIGNVEYVPGYPAGAYWLSNDLRAIHGHKVRSGGSTAVAVLNGEEVSTIFGHVHRAEHMYRTAQTRYAGHIAMGATYGCLADITGPVPSYGSGIDDEGHPVRHIENWINGLGRIILERATGRLMQSEQIIMDTFHPKHPYQTYFNGKVYQP